MAGDGPCAASDAVRSTFNNCAAKQAGATKDAMTAAQQQPMKVEAGGLMQKLQEGIMADFEAMLDSRSSNLLRDGHRELGKIQEEQAQVTKMMDQLSSRQDALQKEQAKMHSAIADIMSKLDMLAGELWQAMPNPTESEQVLLGYDGGLTGSEASSFSELPMPTAQQCAASSTASCDMELAASVAAAAIAASDPFLVPPPLPLPQQDRDDAEAWGEGPRTPQRAAHGGASGSSWMMTPTPTTQPSQPQRHWPQQPNKKTPMAPPLPGSPAVKLSLESALSSTTVATTPAPARLKIADCLDMESPPCVPFQQPQQLSGQVSGKMRAEAPVFVPGMP